MTHLVRSLLNFFIVSLRSFTLGCAITIGVSVGEVSVGVGHAESEWVSPVCESVGGCMASGDK